MRTTFSNLERTSSQDVSEQDNLQNTESKETDESQSETDVPIISESGEVTEKDDDKETGDNRILDDEGNEVNEGDSPLPNKTFVLNGIEYKTDDNGKVYSIDGKIITSYTFKMDDASSSSERTDVESKRDLTEEEINEMQRATIKDALMRIDRGEKLSTQEVGNLCEMMMDQYYINKGYKPLHDRVTSLDQVGHQGIDGVYEKDGKYVIADAKYNTAQLQETQDGRQMSENWINNRLDACVGKEKADQIRDAAEDDPVNVLDHPPQNGQ